jgi:hypothetical protein
MARLQAGDHLARNVQTVLGDQGPKVRTFRSEPLGEVDHAAGNGRAEARLTVCEKA